MTPVRIGLAGYGRGGRFFHAPLVGLAPECTLAGVLTRSPLRRAELAEDFPGLPVAGRLGELAAAGIARSLVNEAERSGVPLTVYQNRRWDADFRTVRVLLETGALGEVTAFESRMEQYPPP